MAKKNSGIGWTIGAVCAVLVFIFIVIAVRNYISGLSPGTNTGASGGVHAQMLNGKQTIEIGMKNYNYYPNVIRLKQGVPAQIVINTEEVYGCYRSVVIPDFGIRKNIAEGDNVIEFTPNKKGTFPFRCAMGMGTGTIIVE